MPPSRVIRSAPCLDMAPQRAPRAVGSILERWGQDNQADTCCLLASGDNVKVVSVAIHLDVMSTRQRRGAPARDGYIRDLLRTQKSSAPLSTS